MRRRPHLALTRRLWAEARLEPAGTFALLQTIGGHRRRQDAEPDELRPELVADVHRLRGRLFKVQPHLLHGVAGAATHAGGRVLVGGRLARACARGGGGGCISLRGRRNVGVAYDVLPDGRFVMVRGADPSGSREFVLVQHWFEELKRLVPVP